METDAEQLRKPHFDNRYGLSSDVLILPQEFGASIVLMPLTANNRRLTSFLDSLLNVHLAGSGLSFQLRASTVYLMIADLELAGTSGTSAVSRDLMFFVPVSCTSADTTHQGVLQVFTFSSSILHVVTCIEQQGRLAQKSVWDFAHSPWHVRLQTNAPAQFAGTMKVHAAHPQDAEFELHPLIRICQGSPRAVRLLLSSGVPAPSTLPDTRPRRRRGQSVQTDRVLRLIDGGVPVAVYSFRQIPDSFDIYAASYQSIVVQNNWIVGFKGGNVIRTPWTLAIERFATHPIVETLGLDIHPETRPEDSYDLIAPTGCIIGHGTVRVETGKTLCFRHTVRQDETAGWEWRYADHMNVFPQPEYHIGINDPPTLDDVESALEAWSTAQNSTDPA